MRDTVHHPVSGAVYSITAVYRTVADDLNHRPDALLAADPAAQRYRRNRETPGDGAGVCARAGLYPLVSFCRYRAASAAALAVRRVTHRFGDAGRAGDGHRLNWPGRSRAASVSRV